MLGKGFQKFNDLTLKARVGSPSEPDLASCREDLRLILGKPE
jgi:hypothetical protein